MTEKTSEPRMSQSSSSQSSDRSGFFTFFRYFLILCILIIAFQLYAHKPHQRPVVLCDPVYKASHFFGVTLVQFIGFKDNVTPIRNAHRLERMFFTCVRFTGKNFPTFAPSPILDLNYTPQPTEEHRYGN
jgi:hypothetical protein